MNIYFDGNLINNDYVLGIDYDGKMFNDNDVFELGSTICNNVRLTISKDLITQPSNSVEISNLGVFNIDNIEEQNKSYVYTLIDNMVDFNFRYDAQPLIEASQHTEPDGTKYVTLLELLQDICLKANVTLRTTTFLGYQKHISWYDNTITAREYISMIAELNSGYALINNGLYLKQYTNTPSETILENCSNYVIGERHVITRIAIENGLFQPVGTDTGTTIYLNPNNVFLTEQSDLTNIYNILNGYEFYSIEVFKGNMAVSVDTIGNCIAFSDGTNTYKTYKQVNASYNGGWNGKYHFIIGSNKKEETFEINGVEDNYKRLKLQVDRNKNEIGLVAETKVDESEYSKAEIIARINNGQGVAQINADNINLNGVVTANNNFKILLDGSMECKNANIIGGDVTLSDNGSSSSNPSLKIMNGDTNNYARCYQYSDGVTYANKDTDVGKETSIDINTWVFPSITLNEGTIQGSTTTITNITRITSQQISVSDGNKVTALDADFVITPNIIAGNIDCGDGYATKSGHTINFNKTFSSTPYVVATPVTTTTGVIALKITNITTTGFTVMTGGTTDFGNVNINWIAMN